MLIRRCSRLSKALSKRPRSLNSNRGLEFGDLMPIDTILNGVEEMITTASTDHRTMKTSRQILNSLKILFLLSDRSWPKAEVDNYKI